MNKRTIQKHIKAGSFSFIRFWNKINSRMPPFFSTPFFILISTLLVVALLFPYIETVPSFVLPKIGEASRETIIAPFTFDIVRTPDELEREKKKARDQVLLVFDYDSEVKSQVQARFEEIQNSLNRLFATDTADLAWMTIYNSLSKKLSENTLKQLLIRPELLQIATEQSQEILEKRISSVLLVQSADQLQKLRGRYNTTFDKYQVYGLQFVTLRRDSVEMIIGTQDLSVKEIALENAIKRLKVERKLDAGALNSIYELLLRCINPNVLLNEKETSLRRKKASDEVPEILGKVIKDTEIVRKHQEVTAEIIQKLRSMQIVLDKMGDGQEKRKVAAENVGKLLLSLLPLLFAAVYIKKFEPKLMKNNHHLLALAMLLCIQVSMIRAGLSLSQKIFTGSVEMPYFIPEYIIPVSISSLLAAILFGINLSLILTIFISTFFGLLMGFNHFFFIYSLLGGIVAGLFGSHVRYRLHFFKVIAPVGMINIVLITLWHLIGLKFTVLSLIQNYVLALSGVVISVLLAMFLTPVFERLFDITTDMTLVELSDMNHPILKRLSIEAAGTYNHSVLVGNLAESAALKIGANALLARVASYYHDIGKIAKADYFVENCLTLDKSRHTGLDPAISAAIILEHVKDGLELAKKNKLPKVIQDVIIQHHGNSTMSFFYEKALEKHSEENVEEQDFRYPGPVPQTPEAAIIMLADSVEAAARSLGSSSPELLKELANKIIKDKFIASQLDQSDLTLRDLDEIVEGFMPVLKGIFHSRIEYPSREKEHKGVKAK